jgi:hypothetical protein
MTITPGDYKTRDGRKATVAAINENAVSSYVAIGWFDGLVGCWTIDGLFGSKTNGLDLIEPWLDPVPWDWSATCPWYNYLAMDKSGDWYLYASEPALCDDSWHHNDWLKVPSGYKPKWTGCYSKSLTSRNVKQP